MRNIKPSINIIMAYGEHSGDSSSSSNQTATKTNEESNIINREYYGYTTGDVFSLDGRDYSGSFNVTNNNFYTGKEVNVNSSLLALKDNVKANYIREKYFFSRIITESLTLPFSYDNVKFQPSEFINQNSINTKLKKLNDNFKQLYNYCFLENNDLPENYAGFIGVENTGSTFQFNLPERTGFDSLASAAYDLNNLKRFEVIPRRKEKTLTTPDVYLTLFATSSALIAFTAENDVSAASTLTFRASTVNVDGFNTREYSNIADITTDNKDLLFVSDTTHNQIYRIFISPLINNSRITSGDKEYLNIGGSTLNTTGNKILSTAKFIEYSQKELFTYNTGISSFIVLDSDLRYKRQYSNKELKEKEVVSFAVNEVENKIYALMKDYSIIKIPTDFKTEVETTSLTNVFNPITEFPRKIIFSKNDSNIYYVATNNNIYKYYNVGNLSPVGKINLQTTKNETLSTSNRDIFDAAILEEDNDHDSIFFLNKDITTIGSSSSYNGDDKILRFNEKNTDISVLEDTTFKTFSYDDIKVTDQYFNNITFNKSLKKLIFNLDILSSHITSKFKLNYTREESKDNPLVLNSLVTLSASNIFPKSYDMFVGANEVVLPQVINRCLLKVIEYQNHVLRLVQGNITNTKIPITEPVVITTS